MAGLFSFCFDCIGRSSSSHVTLKEMPTVQLDTHHMGTDVVVVKRGRRICGTGGCIANAPLHQNKSYFEFKIQSTGVWGIGVATQKANLNQVPMGRDANSLVLRQDGSVYCNDEEKNRLPANSLPQEGDIVWMTVRYWIVSLVISTTLLHKATKRFSLSSRSSELQPTPLLTTCPLTCHLYPVQRLRPSRRRRTD
uniref:SPRY domain-containing protein 7 n=1 Tax=Electrophorus electricus TaxID=8005 RepID=A0A4W4HF75_ELEEL